MPFDDVLAGRFSGRFVTGRALYDEVIVGGVLAAKRSVWIATANVKELYVGRGRSRFGSILGAFAELHARGVELRLLHAELPSRRFRAAFDRHPELVRGGLKMKQCPRVHLKAIVVDGGWLYVGSANLTGAGLGAKGEHKRNFEFGFITEEDALLDRVQTLYAELWRGSPCSACALRDVCPDPGSYARGRVAASTPPPGRLKRSAPA